jgi:putative intracellular protease/amidase
MNRSNRRHGQSTAEPQEQTSRRARHRGFEESELTEPVNALREPGASVDIVSETHEPIQAFRHHTPLGKVDVDKTFEEIDPSSYDALMLPGGALNADQIRISPKAQPIVQRMNEAHKPLAVVATRDRALSTRRRGRRVTFGTKGTSE